MAKRANGDASRFEQLRAKTITITDGCGGMQCNAHKSTTDTDGLADAWGLSVMLCRPYIRGDAQASGYKLMLVCRRHCQANVGATGWGSSCMIDAADAVADDTVGGHHQHHHHPQDLFWPLIVSIRIVVSIKTFSGR